MNTISPSITHLKSIAYIAGGIVAGLIVGMSVHFVLAWNSPQSPPPNGNVSGILIDSALAQYKLGALGINTSAVPQAGFGLTVGGNVIVGGKAYSVSTVATDPGSTLVTKDYLDGKIPKNCTTGLVTDSLGNILCAGSVSTPTSTQTPAACGGQTISNCSVTSLASGQSAGYCASGYSGTCNYTCSNGTLSGNYNSCTPPSPSPSPSPSPLPAACSGQTISNCSVTSLASGQSAGYCASGYSGTCLYTCSNGTLSGNYNSCTPPVLYEVRKSHRGYSDSWYLQSGNTFSYVNWACNPQTMYLDYDSIMSNVESHIYSSGCNEYTDGVIGCYDTNGAWMSCPAYTAVASPLTSICWWFGMIDDGRGGCMLNVGPFDPSSGGGGG